MTKRVLYIFPTAHHYRLPFHEHLKVRLAAHDIDYRVVYSSPSRENISKRDTVEIPWGIRVRSTRFPAKLVYQHSLWLAIRADLVIIQQESSLLLNYALIVLSWIGIVKVAYFGHGRNFQSRRPDGLAERWKRFWAKRVFWWFGYTDETRHHLISLGFPAKRISVFNNSVDTRRLRDISTSLTHDGLNRRRAELGLVGNNICIFVGGIYPDKRIEFLIAAAVIVRKLVPDFELIVAGGGSEYEKLVGLTERHFWIKVVGPKFGLEKVELMKLAQLFLMPGLVGLAILDAAVLGLPTVTTEFPWHSPEIAYLENGVNGLKVPNWESADEYGHAVADLLHDRLRLSGMSQQAYRTASILTIESMADRFASGVLSALSG